MDVQTSGQAMDRWDSDHHREDAFGLAKALANLLDIGNHPQSHSDPSVIHPPDVDTIAFRLDPRCRVRVRPSRSARKESIRVASDLDLVNRGFYRHPIPEDRSGSPGCWLNHHIGLIRPRNRSDLVLENG